MPLSTNSALLVPRPGTGNLIGQTTSKTTKNSPNNSKIMNRPKTSNKAEPNNYQSSSATTASTNNRTAQTKSLGEESAKKMLKKAKPKSSSRPSSGTKKRPT